MHALIGMFHRAFEGMALPTDEIHRQEGILVYDYRSTQ